MKEISALIKRDMIECASSLCSPPFVDTMEKIAVCKVGRQQTGWCFDLGHPTSITVRNTCLFLSYSIYGIFIIVAQMDKDNTLTLSRKGQGSYELSQ